MVAKQPSANSPAQTLQPIARRQGTGRPLRGLAGVVAARNKRDADKMRSVCVLTHHVHVDIHKQTLRSCTIL
eukprot:SAG11_NODE_2195_length_3699_cov_22.646919_2_plen_72_part_00